MPICESCGEEFDLSSAKRSIGQIFGAGAYDDLIGDQDLCADCARAVIGDANAAGADDMDLMGWEWD